MEKISAISGIRRVYFYGTLIVFLFSFQVGSAQDLDRQILENWHVQRNASLDHGMNFVGATIYPVAVAVPVAQMVYGLTQHDAASIENSLQTVTELAITTVVTYGLKTTVRRNRPYEDYPDYVPYEYDKSPSFPSGHTAFAFATATNLSIQYPKWYVIVPGYLYAGAIGYSRIHLGEHYPSDVLAGAIVGTASAYLGYVGNRWLKGVWKKKTHQRFID